MVSRSLLSPIFCTSEIVDVALVTSPNWPAPVISRGEW